MFKVSKFKFWKKTKVEVLSMAELVEKMDWAEKEVDETIKALVKLQDKLNEGLKTMGNITDDAKAVIERHKAILQKSLDRKAELNAQADQIAQAVSTVISAKPSTTITPAATE
ncbi:hypothetical protein IAQ67_29015 (plasmid) [Paenibacillus peoriae]|uniref:Uncharacterized protein n=1 Tax=Paenibacillus peoriae TaxID=59893 RepID=A0A7H0YH39_9BACL|nr:hypothetical protein [Paenibacillus peoriae]QNR70397.1 hypothetical protein IAQ67_29015 [Paenibacillus peoriae]